MLVTGSSDERETDKQAYGLSIIILGASGTNKKVNYAFTCDSLGRES